MLYKSNVSKKGNASCERSLYRTEASIFAGIARRNQSITHTSQILIPSWTKADSGFLVVSTISQFSESNVVTNAITQEGCGAVNLAFAQVKPLAEELRRKVFFQSVKKHQRFCE